MIFTLFVHLFSVLLLKAYRPPREITWLSGMALLRTRAGLRFHRLPAAVEHACATSRRRWERTSRARYPVSASSRAGCCAAATDVTGATLTRFYGIHVAILPALTTACLGLHLYLVQRHGMSVPPGVERRAGRPRAMPFLPNFLLRDMIGWLAALAVLAALAAFFPTELGQKADPFVPAPAGIQPEWYFMFMFQTLKYLPPHVLGLEGETIGIVGFGLAGLLLALVPFLDQGTRGRLVTSAALLALAYILTLTALGYLANPTT